MPPASSRIAPSGLRRGRKFANMANDLVMPVWLRQKTGNFLGDSADAGGNVPR
jgi:hypothetical protein